MNLVGKRLLVIGGAGFIGSHTVDALLAEDVAEIRIFDDFSRGTRANLQAALRDDRVGIFALGGNILHADVLDQAMEGTDGVFHFAALWLLHCEKFPQAAFDVNVAGTFNVIQACIRNKVGRLVFSSSASVYGDAVEEPMTEDHPYNNVTFYGATKIAGEQMARALHHRHLRAEQRFEYVGLRYMNVFGPRQDDKGAYVPVIMKMLDRIEAGRPPIVFGDGSQAYDFVYVEDCAAANVAAMKADTTDELYNVGTGRKTTIRELAELLLELTGSDLQIRFEPAGETFVKNRVGCPEKARRDLGFEAKTNLRSGLQELIQWRKNRNQAV